MALGLIGIDRVGLAVRSLEEARGFFEKKLGGRFGDTYDVPGQGIRYAPFELGGFTLELLEPTSPDSGVAKFIERRGEGMHHLTFHVKDLDAAIRHLEERGYRVTHRVTYPKHLLFEGVHWDEAFLHPKQAFGVLVHLAQKTPPTRRPRKRRRNG